MSKYIGTPVVNVSVDTVDVTGDITTTDTTPEVIIVNNTHEDTDGGREGKVTFKGQQSGGEESTLAQIQASHDGTSDDEKGDLIFKTNDGSDGASPTEAMRITSDQRVGIGETAPATNLHISSTANPAISIEDTDNGFAATTFQVENGGRDLDITVPQDIIFTSGSDEAMRILSGGNVGIGDASPDRTLHVNSGGTNECAKFESTDTEVTLEFTDTTGTSKIKSRADFRFETGSTPTEAMRIATDGKVGIGTTGGTGKLTVQDSSLPKIQANYNGSKHLEHGVGGSGCGFSMTTGHFMTFNHQPYANAGSDTNLTERMRIDSAGALLHAKTTDNDFTAGAMITYETSESGGRFTATTGGSSGGAAFLANSTSGNVALIRCDGDLENINNRYTGFSDERLKENIVDSNSQWDDVKSVRVRKFSWKSDELDAPNKLGVIAQELEALGMSSLVNTNPDLNDPTQERKSVAYSILYMKAFKALQEAMTRIETLETQNTTQATQIADLITRVEALEGE